MSGHPRKPSRTHDCPSGDAGQATVTSEVALFGKGTEELHAQFGVSGR